MSLGEVRIAVVSLMALLGLLALAEAWVLVRLWGAYKEYEHLLKEMKERERSDVC